MIYTERLLKIIKTPHISEKASVRSEKFNTIVLKVAKYAKKTDIENAVYALFAVKSKKVNILITPKKQKGSSKNISYRCYWKKAYVVLKDGCKLDLINKIK